MSTEDRRATLRAIGDKAIYTYKGEERCSEEVLLGVLLCDEVCFVNERECSMTLNGHRFDNETTVVFVACNDVFAWATADGDDLPNDEILPLYKLWRENADWGPAKWSCLRRKEKPQRPVEKRMRQAGIWDEAMEALPPNRYDAWCQERRDAHVAVATAIAAAFAP